MSAFKALLVIASLAAGCAAPASVPAEAAPRPSGKADGVIDGGFDRWVVRNDLDVPVLVHTGGAEIWNAWRDGTDAAGIEIGAYSISEPTSLDGEAIAVTIGGSPIDLDLVEGLVYVDDEGYRVLEVSLAYRESPVFAELYDALETDGDGLNGDERWVPFGETRTQTVSDKSSDTTSLASWLFESSVRNRLKTQARDNAWLKGMRGGDPSGREWFFPSCQSMGGAGFMRVGEDCSYWPADADLIDTECRATCTFSYQCFRVER